MFPSGWRARAEGSHQVGLPMPLPQGLQGASGSCREEPQEGGKPLGRALVTATAEEEPAGIIGKECSSVVRCAGSGARLPGVRS